MQYLLTVVRKTIFLCLFGKPQKIKLFCIVQNWHNVRNLQMSFRVNSNAIRLKFQNMRCTVLSYTLYHLPLTFIFYTNLWYLLNSLLYLCLLSKVYQIQRMQKCRPDIKYLKIHFSISRWQYVQMCSLNKFSFFNRSILRHL